MSEKQWEDSAVAYDKYQSHIRWCRVCNPLDNPYTPTRHNDQCEEGHRLFEESKKALDIAQGREEKLY
jgi:hypothetical protein